VSCSSEKGGVLTNFYNSLTARFNAYFYAHEGVLEVEQMIAESVDDDPNEILLLYPQIDTIMAKPYKKNTEEIIKMASKAIQFHPNSTWTDDSYLMVAYARLYSADWQNAILTFKYVNTKSNDVHLRHAAMLGLVRTFTEMGDHDRAEEAIQFLEKEKLNRDNQKKFYLEKAHYYQTLNDYNKMVNNLSKADSLLKRKDRRGRIYFIIGQVYQKLNFNAQAYDYYKKCLNTNPDYEIDFFARLNMAQVAHLGSKDDIAFIRKQFAKLLKDTKNADFKDKIYYEYGEFEKKQNNLSDAIGEYKLSAHAGKSKHIKGMAYLRIGQINFDSLKKFKVAKAYYDSAVSSLPADYVDIEITKKRQAILVDLVKYSDIITLNDSLLRYAAMDTALIRKQFDSIAKAQQSITSVKKKKRKLSSIEDTDNAQSASLLNGNATDDNNVQDTDGGSWYFSNQELLGRGQSEFQRVWGDVKLEDNWRRSGRAMSINNDDRADVDQNDNQQKKTTQQPDKPQKKEDVVAKFVAQLPHTDEQKQAALDKIEDAYFHLGDIYYLSLNQKEDAIDSYEKLVNRFPKSEKKPEVLYKLWLIYKEKDIVKQQRYANMLQQEYPESTFAKLLTNPNYLKENSILAEKQKLMYREAYQLYQQNNLKPAMDKITEALASGKTDFIPQMELLKLLIEARTESVAYYQAGLQKFINDYPKHPLKSYAEELLTSSKTFADKTQSTKDVNFGTTTGVHYFVVMYPFDERVTIAVDDALKKMNVDSWKESKLEINNLVYVDKTITMCQEFADRETAMKYYYQFLGELSKKKPFSDRKIYNFVITKDNFKIFFETKSLDEYLTFFDKNYQK